MGTYENWKNKKQAQRETTVYLNFKGPHGIETIDEFSMEPGQDRREFAKYVQKMIEEYRLAGTPVYRSLRPSKEWRERRQAQTDSELDSFFQSVSGMYLDDVVKLYKEKFNKPLTAEVADKYGYKVFED